MKIPLLVILGPTASGKTALSLSLAKALGGEIISTDSRQIYREINIGSDKIPLEKVMNTDGTYSMCHDGVPHYLIDVAGSDQIYTMSDFKRDAEKCIADIHARGKLPMLVGGTGLYIRAIVQNFDLPSAPPNPELRQKFEKILKEKGLEKGKAALHAMLAEKDPQAAATIHPNNIPYVTRALEIIESQGKKVAQKNESPYNTLMIGIDWPREELWKRIDMRVDLQMQRGLIEESRALLEKYDINLPSMSSLGLKEFERYFKGECSLDTVASTIKKNTRHYAKRQQTWFRREPGVHWVSGPELEKHSDRLTPEIIAACLSWEKSGSFEIPTLRADS